MPRFDDPGIKLKQKKPFKRKILRPWDDPENFAPSNKTEEQSINKETTGNQLVNNRETIGNQLVNNRETIGNQLVNNRETIGNQLVNNRETIGNQTKPQKGYIKQANLKPKDVGFKQTLHAISRLFGLQKIALFYIVENCKARGLLHTTPITNEFFRIILNTDVHSVKTTIQRLIKKGFVHREETKKGKGGYTVFSINESIRDATIEVTRQLKTNEQHLTMLVNNRETIGNQLVNNKVNNLPVVSSSYINTTTNNNLGIPGSWQAIDLSAVEQIGFTIPHLVQIYREFENNPKVALSVELVQDSINAFGFDLNHNDIAKEFKKPPAVVLTSLLKQGKPYACTTPAKYLSPHEEAMQEYTQAKKTQRAEQQKIIQELKDVEFKCWQESLTEEELLSLCPETEIAKGLPEKLRSTRRRKKALEISQDYFDAEVWPKKLEEITQELTEQLKSKQQTIEQPNENNVNQKDSVTP